MLEPSLIPPTDNDGPVLKIVSNDTHICLPCFCHLTTTLHEWIVIKKKYACYRELFELLNKRNAIMRTPSKHLTIDETLYPHRGQIGKKIYNPSKPARYGLLVISISDAEVPYTYFSLPYAGKPQTPNEFYVPGTDEKTMYLVTNLAKQCDITGRNISMDRYFTSIPLSEWLHQTKLTVMGTLKENRIGIPKDIKDIKGRAEKSTIVIYNNDENTQKMMISYVDKKKSGLKNILVLPTMHDVLKLFRDERKKPHVMVFYEKTKGGVDVVDYISSFISTRMKSKRWRMNAFAYSLDTARTMHLPCSKKFINRVHQISSLRGTLERRWCSRTSKGDTENFADICLQPLFENFVIFLTSEILPSFLQHQIVQFRVEDVMYAMTTSRTRRTTRESETY